MASWRYNGHFGTHEIGHFGTQSEIGHFGTQKRSFWNTEPMKSVISEHKNGHFGTQNHLHSTHFKPLLGQTYKISRVPKRPATHHYHSTSLPGTWSSWNFVELRGVQGWQPAGTKTNFFKRLRANAHQQRLGKSFWVKVSSMTTFFVAKWKFHWGDKNPWPAMMTDDNPVVKMTYAS